MLHFTCATAEAGTLANFRYAQHVWEFCERITDPVQITVHDRNGNRITWDTQFNGLPAFSNWVGGLA